MNAPPHAISQQITLVYLVDDVMGAEVLHLRGGKGDDDDVAAANGGTCIFHIEIAAKSTIPKD